MNRFSCTRSLGEDIYFTTLIAENEQQAKEMAVAEVNQKYLAKWRPPQGMERQGSGIGRRRPGPHPRLRPPRGVSRLPRMQANRSCRGSANGTSAYSGAMPRASPMRSAALSPWPVSTTTVVWSGWIVPSRKSRVSAAPAVAAVGSTKSPSRPRAAERRRDLVFGDGDDAAPRAAQCPQHFGGAHRPHGGDPVGDRRAAPRTARTRRRRPPRRLPRPRNSPPAPRRAAAALPSISPARFELVEAALETEDVAAVAGRHQDVVGEAKAELLPQLEGQGLGALDKIGMPVVAGVKAFAGSGERRLGHRLRGCPGSRGFRRRMAAICTSLARGAAAGT